MERPEIRDVSRHRALMNAMLDLDPRRSVALTIDMQRMYLDPAVGAKLLPTDEARALVAASATFLEALRVLGVPVVHASVHRRPAELAARIGLGNFSAANKALGPSEGADVPDRLEGSPSAEVDPALVRDGDIHITSKKTSDAFYGTDLGLLLERGLRPSTVILLGINTETCVYATAFAASIRGLQPIVASDCVGSHRGADHTWMALELMSRTIAWVMPSGEIVSKLTASGDVPRGVIARDVVAYP